MVKWVDDWEYEGLWELVLSFGIMPLTLNTPGFKLGGGAYTPPGFDVFGLS